MNIRLGMTSDILKKEDGKGRIFFNGLPTREGSTTVQVDR